MKDMHKSVTILGEVIQVNVQEESFTLELLTNEKIFFKTSESTSYEVLSNLDGGARNRVEEPSEHEIKHTIGVKPNESQEAARKVWERKKKLLQFIKTGETICVMGICSTNTEGEAFYYAKRVVLMDSENGKFGWERTHWWVQQINVLTEQWLDVLFKTKREITKNDFSEFYRTNLDLLGGNTSNKMQECATMSRFLYGLSSCYLLTGNKRALSAAKACSSYLISAYATLSHDGQYVFWKFGRLFDEKSAKEIIGSQNPDDKGSYALYEQIYALSGLAQFYRATQDTKVLSYIVRTIASFQDFYLDIEREGDPTFTGKGGYFSHIDPVTMRPDSPSLNIDAGDNRAKKNWNSIGDHIPAYLINLLVSIDPLPKSSESDNWDKLRSLCQNILKNCVNNICDHFMPGEDSKFVNERFDKDWNPDHTWGWQQNRGIVGHNLKISWNLTRCGHYFETLASRLDVGGEKFREYKELSKKCYEYSGIIGDNMREVGVDLIRGGIYDAMERVPKNGSDAEFAWGCTKDFWQQEQSILAYYIMQGTGDLSGKKDDYLKLARYCSSFWSMFFLDRDNRKVFFRTTEDGSPVIEGQYGIQGGHAIAGYHAFELSYLAHIYISLYVDKGEQKNKSFALYFRPSKNRVKTLNLLPDFVRPEEIKINSVRINGIKKEFSAQELDNFQISIENIPEGAEVTVEYGSRYHERDAKHGKMEESSMKDIQISAAPEEDVQHIEYNVISSN